MNESLIIIRQMAFLFTMMAAGFAAMKLKVVGEAQMDSLSAYVVGIAMPAVVLSSLLSIGDRSMLLSSLSVVGVTLALMPAMAAVGLATGRLCRLRQPTLNIHLAETLFPNSAFMGIPLVTALYGSEGLLCLAVYNFTVNLVLYTVGMGLVSPSAGRPTAAQVLRRMSNPATYAALLGFGMVMAGLTLPDTIGEAVSALGATSSPVSMVYIGGVLTRLKPSAILRRRSIALTVPLRMIALPIAVFAVLSATGFPPVWTGTVAVICALPPMVGVSLLARQGGSDYIYATEYVLAGTLLSAATIPLVCLLMAAM